MGELRKILCCLDCRAGLLALGAELNTEPIQLTPGYPCTVHLDDSSVQAMHCVVASDEVVEAWKATAPPPSLVVEDPDWREVAPLAATLLAGSSEGWHGDAVHAAVSTARRVVAAAKGQTR